MRVNRQFVSFNREDHDTSHSPVCPLIAQLLVSFLQEMITQLPTDLRGIVLLLVSSQYCYFCFSSESFFAYLLNCLSMKNIPDIPMVYISYALSCIKCQDQFLITVSSFPALRYATTVSLV